jgi:hypothetical protein
VLGCLGYTYNINVLIVNTPQPQNLFKQIGKYLHILYDFSASEQKEFKMNVFMKISSSTIVTFANSALAKKLISIVMYNLCMKTRSPSNVICEVILLSNMHT